MIRLLLKLAFILVIGIVGYNYFLGNEQEQANSREIIGKVRDLGSDAWNLLASERRKLREGKYDGALEKLDKLYDSLRDKATALTDSRLLERLNELDERRRELETELATDAEPRDDTKRKLDDLTAETEALMNEMETKGQPAPR